MTLLQRDKKVIWHPFTQEKIANDVIPVKYGKGSYIYDENNKAYLDLISSWWVNIHGHANKKIAYSIYKQAVKLEQIIFAGFTHDPAVELCEALKKILPNYLNRFFFSDDGSTAVEVALKMAYQYWYNQDLEKSIFLSFEGGYHGDTFGAMSVGKQSGFHEIFSNLFFKVLTIPYPSTWDMDEEVDKKEENALLILNQYLEKYCNEIAAIILEPLIQGASGMNVTRASFIKKVVELVKNYDVLVIFDEIMTGFGRTGTYFALSQIDAKPDFICLSKGITGGFLPLALTVTTDHIYNAFLSNELEHAFLHGHSYTANPIACSAAITSLKLLQTSKCKKQIVDINSAHLDGIEFLKSKCLNIKNTRIIGTISAFDVDNVRNFSENFKLQFLREGLLIRPIGSTIYLLPPYSTLSTEINNAYEKISTIVSLLRQ